MIFLCQPGVNPFLVHQEFNFIMLKVITLNEGKREYYCSLLKNIQPLKSNHEPFKHNNLI